MFGWYIRYAKASDQMDKQNKTVTYLWQEYQQSINMHPLATKMLT